MRSVEGISAVHSGEEFNRPIARTAGRYRLFDSSVDVELALIRSLRGMDIPLAEVKQFLEARRLGLPSCDSLKAKINSKMSEIQQKIQNLHLLEAEMTTILNNWQPCGGAK
jgi:DNA-binding transcriptional MerR regulator